MATTQRKKLVRLLLKGPLAQGYRTNLWTTARFAALIEIEFGVSHQLFALLRQHRTGGGLYVFPRSVAPAAWAGHFNAR